MKRLALILSGILLLAFTAAAQSAHPMVDLLVKHWETSKAFTLAVADTMPADGYSFQGAPPELAFGAMVNHIASGNEFYCSSALGTKPPQLPLKDDSKATAMKNLGAAYDYCIDGLKGMTSDADLMKMMGKAPRQMTAFEYFWGGFTHSAHHRGQLDVFLRLKHIAPASYKF